MKAAGHQDGLLKGYRVLDCSRVLAGPYAGQVMAEMGADVVKVELPGGDPARAIGPFIGRRSAYFSALNTGKRGVVLDLSRPEGRAAFDRLAATAHVVLHNYRPSSSLALGLQPARLLERHPQLVVVTVASYAASSDRAEEPAYDLTIQAEAGLMAVTGEAGRAPVRAGAPVSDLVTGLWAALAAVGALLACARDRRGRHVEVPMLDATLPLLSYMATAALVTGEEPSKVGSGHHSVCPYGAFPTADGWVVLAVLSDKFWPPLCRALDRPDLAADDRFSTNGGRLAAAGEVDRAITDALTGWTTTEACVRLAAADVPHAPVLSLLDSLASPYVETRRLVSSVPSPDGTYPVLVGPLCAGRPHRPAPALGEHTDEVLREVGADAEPLMSTAPTERNTMVPPNDLQILRMRVVTRPLPGKRERCIELCRKMQDVSKPHARDYQFYVDPDTGDLVNWESFDSVEQFVEHIKLNPYAMEYIESVEVLSYEVYAADDPETKQALEDLGLKPAFFPAVI